ncbi:MAG: hypothetical protein OXN20_02655, partial [Gemmatimonadota bacterium]|nr:hypothetical protein [Gemmatimonadota bacterium]
MKREIGKLTAPILLFLVWNIHASDKTLLSDTRVKIAQPDTISVPHITQLDSIAKIISDSVRVRILISERHNPNARDLLLRPADKAIYTTSDLLLRPNENIIGLTQKSYRKGFQVLKF